MPMEDIDKNEISETASSEEDELMMNEVFQGEPDLYFLHHYLSDVLRPAEDF